LPGSEKYAVKRRVIAGYQQKREEMRSGKMEGGRGGDSGMPLSNRQGKAE